MRYVTGFAALAASALAASAAAPSRADDDPAARPDVITFEASMADMTAALDGLCATLDSRRIEEVEVPDATTQSQIDCTGFAYAGKPRLAELVFADDALKFVWILVDEDELEGLTAAFTARYGAPTHATAGFSAYADDFAGVRYDTPEAAFYAPSLDVSMRAQLDAMVAAEAEGETSAD